MSDFKIGDVVKSKSDSDKQPNLVVRSIFLGNENVDSEAFCVSECGRRMFWAKVDHLELVHRPDPHADLTQAIREVLLSDEFMAAFAAAWMKTPIPLAMHFDSKDGERIQSLADYPFGEPAKGVSND